MSKNTPSQTARELGRFAQLQKSHKALLATLQGVLDSGQLPPDGPTRASVVQALADHTNPFSKNSFTEYRVVWCQRPFSLNVQQVLYILARNPEEAMEAAQSYIERQFGVVNFEVQVCTEAPKKPAGVVR